MSKEIILSRSGDYMKLEIISEKDTPLLSRKRISMMANYTGTTPSRDVLKKEIATKLNKGKNLIIIKHIYGRFGAQRCKIIVHVYDDEKTLKRIEEGYLIKKHAEKKQEKSEEKDTQKSQESQKKTEYKDNKNNKKDETKAKDNKDDNKDEKSDSEKEQIKAQASEKPEGKKDSPKKDSSDVKKENKKENKS